MVSAGVFIRFKKERREKNSGNRQDDSPRNGDRIGIVQSFICFLPVFGADKLGGRRTGKRRQESPVKSGRQG